MRAQKEGLLARCRAWGRRSGRPPGKSAAGGAGTTTAATRRTRRGLCSTRACCWSRTTWRASSGPPRAPRRFVPRGAARGRRGHLLAWRASCRTRSRSTPTCGPCSADFIGLLFRLRVFLPGHPCHPLKSLVERAKVPLLRALERCLVTAVCNVGVDRHQHGGVAGPPGRPSGLRGGPGAAQGGRAPQQHQQRAGPRNVHQRRGLSTRLRQRLERGRAAGPLRRLARAPRVPRAERLRAQDLPSAW